MKKYFLIVVSVFAINFPSNKIKAASQDDNKEDKDLYSESDKKLHKAQYDIVYDPVKKKWTRVKNLTGVKTKDKKSVNDDDKLIYDDSWAFNEEKGEWEEVDVNSELYEDVDDEVPPTTFWQNLSINLYIGGGWAYYSNSLQGLSILKRGNDTYFQSNAQKKNKEATLVKWFYDAYSPGKFDDKTAELVNGSNKEKVYSGNAMEVPLTLSIDYTFDNTIRLGLEFAMEAYVIDKVALESTDKKHKHSIGNMMNGKAFLWNIRPIANVGYLFHNDDSQNWLLNMQIGPVFDKEAEIFGVSRKNGLFMSWGIGWEPKINGYFTLATRISYGFKRYKDDTTPTNAPIFVDKGSSVTMWQHSIKGEIGLRVAFGNNSNGDNADE